MYRSVGLWSDLTEDEHEQREHAGSHGYPLIAPDSQYDDRDERGREIVGEVIAEQDETDQAVGPLEQALGQDCPPMAGFGHGA